MPHRQNDLQQKKKEAFQRLQAELECLRSQHRAKRQSFIDTGCAAPWKVKHSSPDSDGRTARSDPHILVPPESSVTVVAMSGEFAAAEVAEDGFFLVRQRGTMLGAPEDVRVNLFASREFLVFLL